MWMLQPMEFSTLISVVTSIKQLDDMKEIKEMTPSLVSRFFEMANQS